MVFLEEGCHKLPSSLAQECKTFVDENIDTLMGIIIQELDPDSVCSLFKICPGNSKIFISYFLTDGLNNFDKKTFYWLFNELNNVLELYCLWNFNLWIKLRRMLIER